jgi:cell wall assembly regulator SMI1
MPNHNSLLSNLDDIFRALVELGRPVVSLLQPGRSRMEIAEAFSKAGLNLPEELVHLYGWRDGTSIPEATILDDIHFFPGFYLLSLDHALAQYLALRGDIRWNSSWFPLFGNGGGDFYAINLPVDGDDRGVIVGFMLSESTQPIEYESLQSMVATLAESYREGAFFVTSEGWLEMDSAHHGKIAQKNNPHVPLWQS